MYADNFEDYFEDCLDLEVEMTLPLMLIDRIELAVARTGGM